MTSPTILVTGATGLLGPYLVDAAVRRGKCVATSLHGGDRVRDLTDPDAVRELIQAVQPEIVLHAAALTDLELCERQPERADLLNYLATANLSHALPPHARLVMMSTDQVYPDCPGPHAEGAEAPINVYGRSKLAGEAAALKRRNTIVLRINLFGPSRTPGRASLSDFFTEKFSAGENVTLFSDALFSPLHMATLSELSFDVLEATGSGVYNIGSRQGRSKADFAYMIADHLGLPTHSACICESTSLSGRAPRPSDLRLDVSRIEGLLRRPMPTLGEEVEKL